MEVYIHLGCGIKMEKGHPNVEGKLHYDLEILKGESASCGTMEYTREGDRIFPRAIYIFIPLSTHKV